MSMSIPSIETMKLLEPTKYWTTKPSWLHGGTKSLFSPSAKSTVQGCKDDAEVSNTREQNIPPAAIYSSSNVESGSSYPWLEGRPVASRTWFENDVDDDCFQIPDSFIDMLGDDSRDQKDMSSHLHANSLEHGQSARPIRKLDIPSPPTIASFRPPALMKSDAFVFDANGAVYNPPDPEVRRPLVSCGDRLDSLSYPDRSPDVFSRRGIIDRDGYDAYTKDSNDAGDDLMAASPMPSPMLGAKTMGILVQMVKGRLHLRHSDCTGETFVSDASRDEPMFLRPTQTLRSVDCLGQLCCPCPVSPENEIRFEDLPLLDLDASLSSPGCDKMSEQEDTDGTFA
ncbi:hypothetical protein F5Y15DRAFT_137865 [Xylariaceae sp. FL0016]|nr:hypothetical protein F5Y15DRAFT_137865 [Xylariaceae sp. FL0016]